MSTEALPWFAQADIDSPWRRLHWTLPLALLICAIVFIWFAYSMEEPAKRTPEPVPVDAQLIELPAPAAAQAPAHQPPVTPAKTRPAVPSKPAPPIRHEQPSEQPAPTAPPPPATPPPAAPAIAAATSNAPALTESRGAQALYRPLPVIPDELRQEAMNEAATARFHIAADGTTTVELVRPTQYPRLNRLLMETLKTWKFFPAMKAGKPVDSVEEMVIRVQVK